MNHEIILTCIIKSVPSLNTAQLADAWLLGQDDSIPSEFRSRLITLLNTYLFETNKVAAVSAEIRSRGRVM